MHDQTERARVIKDKWVNSITTWEKLQVREFPWRVDRSPYNILISEILLKRTTSTAALRVYTEFLNTYPTIFKLSKAKYEELEEFLRPIGLYRQRAKHLKEISGYVVTNFNGEIPDKYDVLMKVPGIGDYTASAILSIANSIPKALIDSNVERVISRAFNVKGKELKVIAEILVPQTESDIYNYGMVDLGALICHYRYPKHEECPVKKCCYLYKHEYSKHKTS